ncbi:MAG TPA: Spy/CpxP family protein refolding chaperone [Gemmatimonadaceae bacterium]|jgi:Spy/CpxP family protein refolding chaperone|nr:Spy/CpxP family protein refolding chaperone [Gemmatimonadaceae bacterium]
MVKFRTAALSAVAVFAFAAYAGAQTPAQKDSAHRGMRGERHGQMDKQHRGMRGQRGQFGRARGEFVKDLNLTDAQKSRIKTIHEKYRPQFQKLREDGRTQFKGLRDARQKGDTSKVARDRIRAQREQFMNRTKTLRQQEQNEIRTVLTSEQRAKWDAAAKKREEAMKNRMEKMKERRQRGGSKA